MPIYLLGLSFGNVGVVRNPPPRDNAFFMPTGPGNPLFPSISQQSTVGFLSTHANRLTKCQSIHWYCLLAFKMWAWCRTHHPEITHCSVPASWKPYVVPNISTTTLRKLFYSRK